MRLYDALITEDFATLAGAIADRIGIIIDPERLKSACTADPKKHPSRDHWTSNWPDDTVMMWIKNRIDEIGGFPEPGQRSVIGICFPVPMHIGFIGIDETEDQIARLRSDPEAIQESSVARSKMFETLLANVHPIDRVADRVAHDPRE